MENQQIEDVARILNVSMKIVMSRILTLLAMLLSFGLYAWAMYAPSQEKVLLAGMFSILVFLPCIFKESRGS